MPVLAGALQQCDRVSAEFAIAVATHSIAHVKVRNHCVVDVDAYLRKQADAPTHFGTSMLLCPDYLHHSFNTEYCPSTLTCSDGFVLCDDNTCRRSSLDCPVTRVCPRLTCPFGSCVESYEHCATNIVCKKGYRLCSDRICYPRGEKCPNVIDELHDEALREGKKVCKGGEVVGREELCPNIVCPLLSRVPQ